MDSANLKNLKHNNIYHISKIQKTIQARKIIYKEENQTLNKKMQFLK